MGGYINNSYTYGVVSYYYMAKKYKVDHPIFTIIKPDMVLNWVLGVLFLFAPDLVEDILAYGALLPIQAWWVLGVGFLAFAAWQTWFIRRGYITSDQLKAAALLAWGPVVGLTLALFMNFPLKPFANFMLWIANIYMLVLGVIYWRLATKDR